MFRCPFSQALPKRYNVGALGSRVTQEQRRQRMLAAGIHESDLAKLHGPIGINLGGQTPEEIALAVMAEIVAVRNGRSVVYSSGE